MTEKPTPGAVQRRTVVAGAAWTIPVVATAVGAPLAAASITTPPQPPVCNQFPPASTWTWQVPRSGFISFPFYFRDGERFASSADATPGFGTATMAVLTTLEVVQGKRYHFTMPAFSNPVGSQRQALNVYLNGQQVFAGTTRPLPGVEYIPPAGNTYHYEWTANATGPVQAVFEWMMPDTAGLNPPTNQDINFTRPTVTCL
ncbi:hypothetical protein C1I63_08785 [Rathayibacter caricis DSM 15933]|uniref:Uncharacterized protein n=1 Tax=Rathayibacter caricis DSM 15933 TaxID=1328867 RepID=A0A2T4UTT5_9MICO|nr:hypothetical protein [Rathayibacter caricis]PTL72935.1 hypothetical protein C1I63_08785 [Rathayibacter caricis DSM 15933]